MLPVMTTLPTGGYGDFPTDEPFETRTSVLAILALVFGLLCFIPGLPLVGVICGIAALLMIPASNGRVTGKGLAAAGLVLSLLFSALQIGIVVGGSKVLGVFQNSLLAPAGTAMSAIESGDFVSARAVLTPTSAAKITDADFQAFRDGYHGELGAYKSTPKGFIEAITAYGQIGPMMQQFQGRSDAIPIPLQFEKGMGLLVYQIDPGTQGSGTTIPVANIMVLAPSGTKWTLWDPQRAGLAPGTTPDGAPGGAPTTPPTPAESPAPADPVPAPSQPEPSQPAPTRPDPG